MALTRDYPNNITPGGTKRIQGFINDDLEIKRILGLIENVGSINLSDTKRQSVLSAHVDASGNPDYITATGLNVSIDGATTPVILAFAAGFDDKGSVDLVDAIKTSVSAWTVPNNATVYLYVDKDASTGLLSYGYSTLPDLYQKAAPTAVLDQHWYDTNACKMKRYNGSAWEEKRRVFVGKVVAGASTAVVSICPMKNIEDEIEKVKIGNVASATKLETARKISGVSFDGTADIELPSGSSPGVTNYIDSGLKFGTPSVLTLPIAAGVASVSQATVNYAGGNKTLTAGRVQLLYLGKDGSIGSLEAVYPAAVASTVCRWLINGDATIASTVGSNNLTETGTIAPSSGRAGQAGQGNSASYYTAASAANIPAYASASSLRVLISNFSGGVAQCFYHDGIRNVAANASNNLLVGGVDTGYTLTAGNDYEVLVTSAGNTTTGSVNVNGVPVFSGAIIANATAVAPKILANTSNTEKSPSGIEYVEILNAQVTDEAEAQAAAGLLFPVCWTAADGTRKNITSTLPADTISLGMVRTSASSILLYDDSTWQWGRREKAYGGNREVFLGREYFSTTNTTLSWQVPFGTRKYRVFHTISSDAKGTNETMAMVTSSWGAGAYGCGPYKQAANTYTAYIGGAGIPIKNVALTTGYVGCYVEVLEDD